MVEVGGSTAQPTRQCPWCAETVKRAAIVCRYCGRDIPSLATGDERLAFLRSRYGSKFESAVAQFESLDQPPLNPVAWIAELCDRIAAGAPPEAAAARIPRDWKAADLAPTMNPTSGLADFSGFPPHPNMPTVTGGFLKRIRALGDLRGYTKDQIVKALGSPNSTSAAPRGCQLLQWQKIPAIGHPYHYALIFDGNGICGGITHEHVR